MISPFWESVSDSFLSYCMYGANVIGWKCKWRKNKQFSFKFFGWVVYLFKDKFKHFSIYFQMACAKTWFRVKTPINPTIVVKDSADGDKSLYSNAGKNFRGHCYQS